MKNIFDKKTLKPTLEAVATAAVLIPVRAFAADPFEAVTKGATDTQAKVYALGLVISAFMLILCGVGLMLSKKLREAAKEHMGHVVIGVVVMIVAPQVIAWLTTAFGGGN